MDLAIEIVKLGKTFSPSTWPLSLASRQVARPVRALRDVSFQVGRGEVFGLLGPNGAGKTTLLKITATMLLPSAGTVRIHGIDVARDDRRARRLIGHALGNERGFYWRLSGRENLEFFAGLWGMAPTLARRRVQTTLALVGLLAEAPDLVARYSTGMRHRLDIARALLADPGVLLFDEPTRSLDPTAAQDVRMLLRELATEHGKTVLLVTHDLAEATATCNRVAILVRGAVRKTVSLEGVEAETLADLYNHTVGELDSPLSVLGHS